MTRITTLILCVVLAVGVTACATTGTREPLPQTPMGMGRVQIEAVTNDPVQEGQLRVSMDGTRLLFNMIPTPTQRSFFDRFITTQNNRAVEQSYSSNSIAMLVIGQPGRNVVSQEGARDAAWYPDGERFAFSMMQGPQAMLASGRIGQGGGAVRFLTPTPCVAYDWQPSVSFDGSTILFSTFTINEPETLATMEISQAAANCKLLFPGKSAQWSPTDRRFAFIRVVNEFSQIFIFDEVTNQLTQISFGSHNNYDPTWSPDGRSVAFVSDRNGSGDIYVIEVDGTGLVQLTQGPTEDATPAWSQDGNIYFVSNAGGQWDIWRATLENR